MFHIFQFYQYAQAYTVIFVRTLETLLSFIAVSLFFGKNVFPPQFIIKTYAKVRIYFCGISHLRGSLKDPLGSNFIASL